MVVVIDVGDGLIEMINPTMVDSDGEQVDRKDVSHPGIFGKLLVVHGGEALTATAQDVLKALKTASTYTMK